MMGCFDSYYENEGHLVIIEPFDESSWGKIDGHVGSIGGEEPPFALAIWKDRVDYVPWEALRANGLSDLLELRVFGVNGEVHVSRDALGDAFSGRIILDGLPCPGPKGRCPIGKGCGEGSADCLKAVCALDEIQMLDFSTASKSPMIEGVVDKDEYNAIRIRNYIRFDEEGVAQAADFRIVDFCKGSEED